MHYQLSLQVSNTQGATVAQAVAAAVRKAVEGAVGARVTDAFNPVY
ncbi:MAG: hypothetical protein JWN15_1853, partial [Firmicutes bacterium]|nr:hypothetical protein [Bacillota bacterium]